MGPPLRLAQGVLFLLIGNLDSVDELFNLIPLLLCVRPGALRTEMEES